MPMLKKLKSLQKRERVALTILLMLGIITIVASCFRIAFDTQFEGSLSACKCPKHPIMCSWTYILPDTIENTEITTQILVVTLPALRPLLGAIRQSSMFARLGGMQVIDVKDIRSDMRSAGNSTAK